MEMEGIFQVTHSFLEKDGASEWISEQRELVIDRQPAHELASEVD